MSKKHENFLKFDSNFVFKRFFYGNAMAAGLYLISTESGGRIAAKRILLAK